LPYSHSADTSTNTATMTTDRNNNPSYLAKLLLSAVLLSLAALFVGVFYTNSIASEFPLRQLSAYKYGYEATYNAESSTKTELVSFRMLQPDGSLEIKHIDVDTAVKIDLPDQETSIVVPPRRNLRPKDRQLEREQESNDDSTSDKDLALYRKVNDVHSGTCKHGFHHVLTVSTHLFFRAVCSDTDPTDGFSPSTPCR